MRFDVSELFFEITSSLTVNITKYAHGKSHIQESNFGVVDGHVVLMQVPVVGKFNSVLIYV